MRLDGITAMAHPGAPPLHLPGRPVRVKRPAPNKSPELETPSRSGMPARSRHGHPVRTRRKTPSTDRLLSLAVTPRSLFFH